MGWEVSILRYFPGLLFSAMFSYGLFYFTDVFSTLLHEENRLERLERENDEYLKRLSSLEIERDGQNEALNALSQEKEDLSLQLNSHLEGSEEMRSKAEQYEVLLSYLLESEGFLEKSPQALRKGVEYWRKRIEEGEQEPKALVKLMAYEGAYSILP